MVPSIDPTNTNPSETVGEATTFPRVANDQAAVGGPRPEHWPLRVHGRRRPGAGEADHRRAVARGEDERSLPWPGGSRRERDRHRAPRTARVEDCPVGTAVRDDAEVASV